MVVLWIVLPNFAIGGRSESKMLTSFLVVGITEKL